MNSENGIRNHFSIIIVDTFKMVWAILAFLLFNVLSELGKKEISELDGTPPIVRIFVIGGVALFVLIALFINFLHWRKTYITIDDENLIVNKNYFFQKKVKTVRLSSIATVNFQQGIPERIFGTYKLQLDINSSVTANSTDFNLVFDKETAQRVKEMLSENLFAGAADVKTEAEAEDEEVSSSKPLQDENPTLIYQFSYKQVVRHCLLGFSFFSLFLMLSTAGATIAAAAIEEGFSPSMLLPALVVIVPLFWIQITPFFNFYGFKIEKLGDRAIVSYGLFTHRQYNLPLDKTNAIIVHQPLFARMFGYYFGELINVGMGDVDNNGTPIFCLCVKEEEMKEIIKQLKPELQVGGLGERSPKEAIIPAGFWYWTFGLVVTIIILIVEARFWWIGLILLAYMTLCAVLSYKTKALAVLNDKAVITTGVFHKRTIVVPNGKIQNIYRRSGPIARKLGLAAGRATVLASMAYKDHDIGYFKKERYDTLFNNIVDVDN